VHGDKENPVEPALCEFLEVRYVLRRSVDGLGREKEELGEVEVACSLGEAELVVDSVIGNVL
jgi:hypothetical protein